MDRDAAKKDNAAKKPSHYAYQINEGQDGKSYYNRVGAAFAHKDGEGFNVVLDAMPVDGRLTLRTPQERLQAMKDDNGAAPERRSQERGR